VVDARSRVGIDWGSRDGKPANELFLIAVPERAAGDAHPTAPVHCVNRISSAGTCFPSAQPVSISPCRGN